LIFLLLITQTVSAENRVTNGDFETGDLTGWGVYNQGAFDSDVSVGSSYAHSGNYGCRLYGEGGDVDINQSVNFTNVDTLSFYYKINYVLLGLGDAKFEVYIDSDCVFNLTNPSTTNWIYKEINVSGYSGTHTLKFKVDAYYDPWYNKGTELEVFLDDVEAEGNVTDGNVTEEDPLGNVTEGNTSWVVSFKVYRCFKPVVNVPVAVSYNGNVTNSGYTDDTGSIAFRLDKLKSYVINVNNSEKVVSVQPVENNYIITLPCNLTQEWETATYNITTGSYAWDLLTTAQNVSSQLSPSARGFISGLFAWLVMYGVSAVGVTSAIPGIIALAGLAFVGFTDWIAVLLCTMFAIGMYIIRRRLE